MYSASIVIQDFITVDLENIMLMKRIILLSMLTIFMIGCNPHYFDPYFESVPMGEGEMLPQEGTMVTIPVEYIQVETKTTVPMEFRPFRYRILSDGEEYSYALSSGKNLRELNIVVPCNDSYLPREITVEVSYADGYDVEVKEWSKWQEIFSADQDCLAENEELVIPSVENAEIYVVIGGRSVFLEPADNGSSIPFILFMKSEELTIPVNVYSDFISTYETGSHNRIRTMVPLNHTDFIEKNALYMTDEGRLILTNKKFDPHAPMTLLGIVPESEKETYLSLFAGDEKQELVLTCIDTTIDD